MCCFVTELVRSIWTYGSTDRLDKYFKAMKAYKNNKNGMTAATLSLAAKNLRPMVKQLLENLKRKEAADVRANFRKGQQFSLESEKEIGEQLKALSYLLKKL